MMPLKIEKDRYWKKWMIYLEPDRTLTSLTFDTKKEAREYLRKLGLFPSGKLRKVI
jgi:hypothetical protein